MWDGITGLVTQPIAGAKKEGGAGFVKGFGRGIAGIVVKPGAGFYSLPGYAMKGIYKEVQRRYGKSVENYIIAARTAQGWEMFLQIDKDEQTAIVHRYLQLMEEVRRKRAVDMDSLEIEVDVNESYINRVKTRAPAQAVLDAYQDWQIPARVIAIIPTADRGKATVKVRVGLVIETAPPP